MGNKSCHGLKLGCGQRRIFGTQNNSRKHRMLSQAAYKHLNRSKIKIKLFTEHIQHCLLSLDTKENWKAL